MPTGVSDRSAVPKQYNAYKVRDGPVLSDPDVPGTRYHTKIFVETSADGSGRIQHVTGDLVSGMHYETKPGTRPEDAETFYRKDLIGTVLTSLYPAAVDEVCAAQPPPLRQKAFNVRTMRTEPCKPDGSFYGEGEQRPALFKCTEWIEQRAVPALRRGGVLQGAPAGNL